MSRVSVLEKAWATVAPIHATKRAAAKKMLPFINSGYGNYGANQTKKSMRGWEYYGGSEKEDIEDNIDVLRQRSRDAYMGIPTASAALKTLRTNVVAGGLVPAPQIDAEYLGLTDDEAEELQGAIMREFSIWADSPTCDAERMDNFYQLQQLAFLSYLMSGDAIVLLPVKQQAGQPYDLRIRLIEADRVCSPNGMDRLTPCEVQGYKVHQIVQGVETDSDGMVVAYWICNRHPLSSTAYLTQPGGIEWVRVEAYSKETGRRNVLHIMNRERPGQRRGVPILAPVLESLKQMGRYTEAEITAAVISAMFTVFVNSQNPSDGVPFGEMLPPEMQIDHEDENSIELGPAAIVSLNPGEDVKFADPKHPSSGFDTFCDAVIKQIGAALEIPQEILFKQFCTSYSAARGALNEFWRTCAMQRDWFKDDFCKPIYEEWLAEAVAKSRVEAPGFFIDPAIKKAYCACAWSGPARTNLNPVQEIDAAIKRIDAGISTAQEETATMTGGDWNRNIRQRVIEAKRKKEVDDITNQPTGMPQQPMQPMQRPPREPEEDGQEQRQRQTTVGA